MGMSELQIFRTRNLEKSEQLLLMESRGLLGKMWRKLWGILTQAKRLLYMYQKKIGF